ncbi:translocation/assembly module TamB domain-containing protein [Roseibium salinum]|uniref:Translocation/assembly module TamB domain-containing protein n=1 Tax=Roseibium salinum TaxID=1604349 RepID=A0ABT3QVV9_9HYPH|nr:translocation/assembly module TamB domain-containing protein [Roseibium sp. DSM 29163]MCX2721042.1 translocation/assembly module TamB domain-containing protein [Roseibium sp. DSM 29163]
MTRILIALAFLNLGFPATAQETPEEERSRFLSFVENRLSTPNRSIRIRNIQGVLSSEATIGEITIADHEGVWLRIQGVTIDWNRSALILRQRLDVERLAAETIEMLRMPLPDPGLPAPEAGTFTVPELPISIDLGQLEVERLSFEDNVFGLAATVSLEGSLRLEDGTLDAALEVVRLDGPGGQLTLEANYANETQALDINLAVSEPANGMIVNLLDIPGNPPLSLTAAGSGPIDNFDLDISLQAAGEPAADGQVQLRGRDDGLAFTADLSGSIEQLIQEPYRAFFGAQTSLSASGVALNSGAFLLDNLTLASAALQLQAAAETGVDGFLQSLDLDATIGEAGESKVILPVPGGDVSVRSTRLGVVFGKAAGGMWTATLDVVDLATGTFSAQNLSLEAGGEAQNLSQPQQRRITFRADGAMTGISAERPELADALGDRIAIALEGGWQAGAPVMLDSATLSAEAFSLLLAGRIVDYAFLGDIALQAGSIAPFSGLAGRELSGSADLEASGEVRPLTGAFDLRLDGQASDVEVGVAALDSLLAGTTRTTGRIARGPDGIAAENLRIANERVEITADGSFASDAADITFGVDLQDLALITDRATGRLTASGRALGAGGLIDLKFDASVPNGALAGKELGDGQLTFEGTLQDGDLNGDVTGAGGVGGIPVDLGAKVALAEDERSLREIEVTAGRARLTGEVVQGREGLLDGRLDLDAEDISTLAALALVDATGSVNAEILLNAADSEQRAEIIATASDIRAEGITIGSAGIEATATDIFGVPGLEGTVSATEASAFGVEVDRAEATATLAGETTDFSANALLKNGTAASVSGALVPEDGGFELRIDTFDLSQAGIGLELVQPAVFEVRGEEISFDAVALNLGEGRLRASGKIGRAFDVSLDVEEVPLSLANTVRPDLGLGGTVSGNAQVTGMRTQPQITFEMQGRQISAALLENAGVSSVAVDAAGRTVGGNLQVDASARSPQGLSVTADGRIPTTADGELSLDVLATAPLALAERFVADRGMRLTGTASFDGSITGTLAEPDINGAVTTSGVRLFDPTTGVRLSGANLSATIADRTIRISSASATVAAGGRIGVTGSIGIRPEAGFPVDLRVELSEARYVDRELVAATLSGTLTLTGQLRRDPLLAGRVVIDRAEVIVPSHIAGRAATVEVIHRNPPPAVRRTLQKARAAEGSPVPGRARAWFSSTSR